MDISWIDDTISEIEEEEKTIFTPQQFTLHDARKPVPNMGLTGVLYKLSRINFGKSAREKNYDTYVASMNRELARSKKIVILGDGRTTLTMLLAATFAQHRWKGNIIACDANFHGTLTFRAPGQSSLFLPDIASNDLDSSQIESRLQNHGRLYILPSSPHDKQLSPAHWDKVIAVLSAHYRLIFIDAPPFTDNELDKKLITTADAIIISTSPSHDSAKKTAALLETFHHHYAHVMEKIIMTFTHLSSEKIHVKLQEMFDLFHGNFQIPILEIPYDPHLHEAGIIDLHLVSKPARWQAMRVCEKIMNL